MSKTAEQLLEEIAKIYPDGDSAGEYKQNYKLEKSGEMIKKVLDAVCMQVNNVGLSAHDTLATKTAINKLRPAGEGR